jgi:hypothetical protein
MKDYSVMAFFPEVKPAHASEQLGRVQANNIDLAAKRGLRLLRSRPGIKGKRIKTVKLTIRLIEKQTGEKEPCDQLK